MVSGAGGRECERCDDAARAGSAGSSEARPLAAAADGGQQKRSVLANLAHHLRRGCRPAISTYQHSRTAEYIGKCGFWPRITTLCGERPSSSVKGELQVRGGEMQRCRNHWQHPHLGFDETDLTRVRHHAFGGRVKLFGMLVHFSRNCIGRDSSRVTLQADNVNNPSNLNRSRHAAGVMAHEGMSRSQTTRPRESRSSGHGWHRRIDDAVCADAQGTVAIDIPIFPAFTGVDQISHDFPGQCARDMHVAISADKRRQQNGNETIEMLGRL